MTPAGDLEFDLAVRGTSTHKQDIRSARVTVLRCLSFYLKKDLEFPPNSLLGMN